MLSFLEMVEGSEVPEHSHPHEQAGSGVVRGSCSLESVQRRRILKARGSIHCSAECGAFGCIVTKGPARVLDIFTPPREDYIDQYNKHTSTSVQTKWK